MKMPADKRVHNIVHEAALRYAQAGYRVVLLHGVDPKTKACTCPKGAACKAAGKHPRLPNWTKSATRTESVITRWYAKYPDSNVGLMPPEGCIVVDVDPRNGGDASTLGLPVRTPTQTSGSGGTHYVVRVDDVDALPNLKAQGIDFIRPGRGQFVAEPSIHVSGGRYMWRAGLGVALKPAQWNCPVATEGSSTAPELAPLQPPSVEETLDAPVDVVREWLAVVPSEEYSDWINVGQALKHAYGDAAFEHWDQWSEKSDKYPGTEEMRRKWETFDRNRDRALRTLRSIRHLAQRNGWRYTPPQLDFSSDLWRSGLVADLVATDPPPIEWVLGDVLPRGKVVMLGGPGGSGKSFLMLILAIQHALGRDLLGNASFAPPSGGAGTRGSARKVISFTAEDDREDVHRRLHAIFDAYMLDEASRHELGSLYSVQCTRGKDWRLVEDVGGTLVASKAAELIIDKLRNELDLSLIMFDPSIMFAGVEENDNAAASAYMRVLDRIASSLNCAVLVGTHTSKGALSTETVDQSALRGAGTFVDNARGSWVLRTMTADEAAMRGVVENDRHRFACLRVVKNNYGPTGAEVWLHRVAGGALQVAPMPAPGTGGTASTGTSGAPIMPPLVQPQAGTTRTEQRRNAQRAAHLAAHALEVLHYLQRNSDPVLGGASVPERTIGSDLWGADASLSGTAIRDRTRRVIEYCEAQGWLHVTRPSEEARRARTPSTYVLTPEGEKVIE